LCFPKPPLPSSDLAEFMVGKRKGVYVKNRKDCCRPPFIFKLLSLNVVMSKPSGINNHGNNFGITQRTLKACSKHSCEKN